MDKSTSRFHPNTRNLQGLNKENYRNFYRKLSGFEVGSDTLKNMTHPNTDNPTDFHTENCRDFYYEWSSSVEGVDMSKSRFHPSKGSLTDFDREIDSNFWLGLFGIGMGLDRLGDRLRSSREIGWLNKEIGRKCCKYRSS